VTLGNVVYIHTPYNNRQQMCQVWSNGSQGWIDKHNRLRSVLYDAGNAAIAMKRTAAKPRLDRIATLTAK
jgi:hypothetical protein